MSDAEFKSEFSFGVDNGELDGLKDNEIFVLGYELGRLEIMMENITPMFQLPVHSSNKDRIARLAEHKNRRCVISYMQDDRSEDWMWLIVLPKPYDGAAEQTKESQEN